MIYVFAALACELDPLLHALKADPLSASGPVRQWQAHDRPVRLVLTGTGPLKAAACVSSVLQGARRPEDLLLSLGTCASLHGEHMKGEVCRIHRITDLASQHSFYPDPVLAVPLREASILTGAQLLEKQQASVWYMKQPSLLPELYDMECAAVFAAAHLYLGSHQMVFLRLVSDFGDADVSREEVISLQAQALPVYLSTLDAMEAFVSFFLSKPAEPEAEDEAVSAFLQDIHATCAMRLQMEQLLRYARLTGFPTEEVLSRFRAEGKLPCPSKKEGVSLLAAFEHELQFFGS